MKGFHVFYSDQDDHTYSVIDYVVQLASILFWKKNFGEIGLYCNKKYLDQISKWGIDKLYTDININSLESIPYKEYLKKYWSFCKIHAAKQMSKTNTEFVIIDTDLWIHENIKFNGFELVGYHHENFDISISTNPYPLPSMFLDVSDLSKMNWNVPPINCAVLYFGSQRLIDEWYRWCLIIIERNKENIPLPVSSDTIFIEQRLLPTLCEMMGLKQTVLIPNVYQTHIKPDDKGSEWVPSIGFSEQNESDVFRIKHVWGLKKLYSDVNVRSLVCETVNDSLNKDFPHWNSYCPALYNEFQLIRKSSLPSS